MKYNKQIWVLFINKLYKNINKKCELMLTRHAKAYSSSFSQTISLSPAILSQFILGVRAAVEDRKNQ